MHDELLRLNATALSLGTTFAALDELPPERADALRRHVLDVELAAGALVTAVDGLVDGPVDAAARPAVAQVTAALDHDVAAAARASREIADQLDGAGSPAVGMAVRRLAAAAADLGTATLTMQHDMDVPAAPEPVDEPEPAEEPEEPDEQRGLQPTTRTAIQVAVAGTLAILVGGLVAPGQWFWAVITAFVVFAGANSRGELLVRAWSRTAGTLGGVIAGVVVASLVTGHVALQGAVVLLCVFLAFYLLPVSYGLMTFFVTTMLGVLYGLLGRFSVAFLEIRLLETVIGAVAGAVAALLVLPTRTRGVVREQVAAFLAPVAGLLRGAADDLRAGADVRPLAAEARDVDTQMHALLVSARPFGSYRFGDARARYERWRLLVGSCAAGHAGVRPRDRARGVHQRPGHPGTARRAAPPPSPTWPTPSPRAIPTPPPHWWTGHASRRGRWSTSSRRWRPGRPSCGSRSTSSAGCAACWPTWRASSVHGRRPSRPDQLGTVGTSPPPAAGPWPSAPLRTTLRRWPRPPSPAPT